MSASSKRQLKVVANLIEARKPYYLVRAYDSGKLVMSIKRIIKPEYVKRWFFYNQSLIQYGHVVIREKGENRTIRIEFDEATSRHFKIFLYYLYSISNLRSFRKVDCLARCWSKIDATTPVVDLLWDISRSIDQKRFSGLLRGYCLCR
ncbi:MAG: hypothetical protein QXS24_06750 [Desulfurococcaceae archaeon]